MLSISRLSTSSAGNWPGVEVLLRWHHPKWGAIISPASFMEEAESSDILAEVTEFVMNTAVAEISRRLLAIPLRISVNVAPADLERKGFVTQIGTLADGLPAGVSLVLELTERFLLGESARTAAIFDSLRAKGVRFAIDGFGTHNSNLDLLGRFRFRLCGNPIKLQCDA